MARGHTTMHVACLVCHEDMDDRTGIRSHSWYRGLVGTRAVLCSPECQKSWDIENLSYVADKLAEMLNDEEVVA